MLPHETNSLATPLSHAKAGKNSSEGRGADSNFHAAREAKHPSARPVRPTKGSPPPPRSPWELTLGVSPSRLRKLSRGEFTRTGNPDCVRPAGNRDGGDSCSPNWGKSSCPPPFLSPTPTNQFCLDRRQNTKCSLAVKNYPDTSRDCETLFSLETLTLVRQQIDLISLLNLGLNLTASNSGVSS